MNVNPGIPVMNPAMPAVSNPVPTPPTDRMGGGGTSAPAETARAVGDARETEPNRPDTPRDRATEARADQAMRPRDEDAAAGRARVDAARTQEAEPAGNNNPAPATANGETQDAAETDPLGPPQEADTNARMRERLDARMETSVNTTGNRGGEALDEMV
ncbi:hypothetical protein [Ectothiorhodospira mobilis]|uniref:Uncharacterized protein n=1 Tax=Ectothiorhodospira mobilis TaxID=195064 RepID=A0A1I4QTU4_ECTMO|nr:hypothetical protein [Ectothiorhodospira mobilis]MCG5535788.1 hypothetical protein [Ectothiorhodospira mobilis]SFM43494.1 hypothetical protein SAMN05421721_105149 [Ectothiorhodospira mobilis]